MAKYSNASNHGQFGFLKNFSPQEYAKISFLSLLIHVTIVLASYFFFIVVTLILTLKSGVEDMERFELLLDFF